MTFVIISINKLARWKFSINFNLSLIDTFQKTLLQFIAIDTVSEFENKFVRSRVKVFPFKYPN